MAQAPASMRATFTPDRMAASWLSAVARISNPAFERRKNAMNRPMHAHDTAAAVACSSETRTGPSANDPSGSGKCNARGAPPNKISISERNTIDMAMVIMIIGSNDRPASGRMNTRWSAAPSMPAPRITNTTVAANGSPRMAAAVTAR